MEKFINLLKNKYFNSYYCNPMFKVIYKLFI